MKLVLGTAQFGLDYGISGGNRVPVAEAHNILSLARAADVNSLDTAPVYGDSETVLGQYLAAEPDSFRVITKVPPLDKADNPAAVLRETFHGSLKRLGLDRVYGLMMHRASDLLGANGEQIYAALAALQSQGLVERIGISVYQPEEIEAVMAHYPIGIVQVPLNVMDQRFLQEGLFERLREGGVEIHVRSVFLQGLLLLPWNRIPAYFSRWHALFDRYSGWIKESGLSPVAACLQFAHQQSMIDGIVTGVDNALQFEEILAAAETVGGLELPDAGKLACLDEALINPSCWPC